MTPKKKKILSEARRNRVRRKVFGTKERPRMSVKFSGKHIYVQFIDDVLGRTLAMVSSRGKVVDLKLQGANVKNAEVIGKLAATAAANSGVVEVVFDKGAAQFHGKVKALADAARSEGLKF